MYLLKRNWFPLLMFVLLAIVPMFAGCSQIYNPLEGLCYSDRTGTYVCIEEEGFNLSPKEPFVVPKYDREENCSMYTQEEEWRMCMDTDNDHIYDPYFKTRQDLEKRLEREQKLREQEIINSIRKMA